MRIVIAGTQAVSRRALNLLLVARLRVDVVGEAEDEGELMNLVKANKPDLVLLEEDLPGAQLGDLIPALREFDFNPAVIVLDERPETEQLALAAGADAFVYKGDSPKRLLIAIEAIRMKREK
jgi:DNA-binding NarL/FixJ family response regulator